MKALLFSCALLAYPRAFRRRFGAEMRDQFMRSNDGAMRSLAGHVINANKERGSAIARWSFFQK